MIRVKKTIDLQIDLNAYYPSFPAGLRRAIDEEVIRLCSTGGKGEPEDRSSALLKERKRYFWDTMPGDTLVYLEKAVPTRGVMRQVFTAAHRKWAVGEEILFADFKALVTEEYSMATGKAIGKDDLRMFLTNACRNPSYFRVKEDS